MLNIIKTRSVHLIQVVDQSLALLHAVDADDDDPSHGDEPDDEPEDGILLTDWMTAGELTHLKMMEMRRTVLL